MLTDRRPLTREDLIRGCRLAIEARGKPVEVAGMQIEYCQGEWLWQGDCGTVCCIHGFASLSAGRYPSPAGPITEYVDIAEPDRKQVLMILYDGGRGDTAPERILTILGEKQKGTE